VSGCRCSADDEDLCESVRRVIDMKFWNRLSFVKSVFRSGVSIVAETE